LRDPFYYGQIKWNNEVFKGNQEPLIDRELFEQVEKILNQKKTPKYNKHSYLFRGLIRCSECNGLITWEKQKGIIYGHCNGYRKCSKKKWIKENEIENRVIEKFNDFKIKNNRLTEWIKKALKESHKDETEYHNKNIDELNRRYEQIQKRLNILYDDKLDSKITIDFYNQKFNQYNKEKEEIISTIKGHSGAQTKYFQVGVNILDISQRAKEIYQDATIDEKRQLFNLVFDNLLLDKEEITFKYTEAFNILNKAIIETNSSKVLVLEKNNSEIFEQQFLSKKQANMSEFERLLPG